MRIIGLTGYARSGKDTVSRLIERYAERRRPDAGGVGHALVYITSFALPMKDFCREVFGFTEEQLNGNERERPDERWMRPSGQPLTARFALQTLGTEWGRNCDPDLWVKVALARARANQTADLTVFTDVRFLNEARAITEAGGEVWRIRRGERAYSHSSEADIWSVFMEKYVSQEIDNRGTLEELEAQVKASLKWSGL